MRGEQTMSIAEKFLVKASQEEIAERNRRALVDRERYRREQKARRDADRP